MTTVYDPTPLTHDELLFFIDAALYGGDHRNAVGYAMAGSVSDAAGTMLGALATLDAAAQAGTGVAG